MRLSLKKEVCGCEAGALSNRTMRLFAYLCRPVKPCFSEGVNHVGLEGRYRDFAFLACLRGVRITKFKFFYKKG